MSAPPKEDPSDENNNNCSSNNDDENKNKNKNDDSDGEEKIMPSSNDHPSSSSCYNLASTTTKHVSVAITSFIILSHALLLWGMTGKLWGMFVVDSINVAIFNQDTVTTDTATLIASFSYIDMVVELWKQPYAVTKLTAALLVLFSAIWPHLKLVLLHVYYYLPTPSVPRRSALYWLGSIGKMSLADICATCMIFMLLNLTTTIDVGELTSTARALIREVVPDIINSTPGLLSDATQSLLDQVDGSLMSVAYDVVDQLSDSIFENQDYTRYEPLLQSACGTYHNTTCIDTVFYEPTNIIAGIPGIMTKCLRIRDDECSQCECIVNNVIYNDAIPDQMAQTAFDTVIPMLFSKVLTSVEASGRFENLNGVVEGEITVGSTVEAYPAFLAFTFGILFSIIASIIVEKIEEADCMQRNHGTSSIKTYLKKSGMMDNTPSYLFLSDDDKVWTKVGKFACSLIAIPLTFLGVYIKMFDWEIAGLLAGILNLQQTAVQSSIDVSISIIDSVVQVNDGSGYGWTFTILYGILLLAAPLLRALLLTLLGIFKFTPLWHIELAHWSNSVGGFIAWEPFFICIILLTFELPSLTSEIIPEATCESIQGRGLVARLIDAFDLDTADCFIMYYSVLPPFAIFVIAWAFLTTFNIFAWKSVLRKYDIFGNFERGQKGGPYFACRQCCHCPGMSYTSRKRSLDDKKVTRKEEEGQHC